MEAFSIPPANVWTFKRGGWKKEEKHKFNFFFFRVCFAVGIRKSDGTAIESFRKIIKSFDLRLNLQSFKLNWLSLWRPERRVFQICLNLNCNSFVRRQPFWKCDSVSFFISEINKIRLPKNCKIFFLSQMKPTSNDFFFFFIRSPPMRDI